MKVDFNKLKTEISLPDLLIHLGWKFAPGSSNSSPKMTDGHQIIVVKKNGQGQYTYWDTHDESIRGRSVIDVMQQHLYNETGKMPSLREVGETLQTYLNSNSIVIAQDSKFDVSNATLDEGQLAFLNNQLKPYSGNFLERRGISQETLSSPVFNSIFCSREFKKDGKTYNNTCIRMVNTEGFQGISQRGIREEDGKSFKGISGNKFSSIAVSKHDKSRPIDQIYVGESMIDCASHYQLKNLSSPNNILYISTEGNLTQGQMNLINLLLLKQKNSNPAIDIVYIFDNDISGNKFALKLDSFLFGKGSADLENLTNDEIKLKINQLPNIELSNNKDWNDDLKISVFKERDQTFQEAIKKNDFSRLTDLKQQGYHPSTEVLKRIEGSAPTTMIIVQKIYDLPVDSLNLRGSKLTKNEGTDQSQTMQQSL